MQLADIFDYVTPCFPEKYGIFKVIFTEYHQHLSFMLDCIGCCAEQLANSDILKVHPLPALLVSHSELAYMCLCLRDRLGYWCEKQEPGQPLWDHEPV